MRLFSFIRSFRNNLATQIESRSQERRTLLRTLVGKLAFLHRAFGDAGAAGRCGLVVACVAAVVLAGTAGTFAGSDSAGVKPDDLPPPPGSLQRELDSGLQAPGKPDNVSTGGASALSQPIEIPFILEGGHIIVEASINGGPQRPFLFDTGASHVIDTEVAKSLNAPMVRTGRIGGFGAKVSTVQMIKADRISIGGVTLTDQTVAVMDMPNVILDRGSRPRLAGLIGAELLSHYAVTIDYARLVLTLNSPGFKPPLAKFSLPLGFSISPDGLGHPSIVGEVDGVSSEFIIDTGSPGQVHLSERFQEEHKPFASAGKVLHFMTPGGIGGRASIREAFGKQVHIGPSVLPLPLITGVDFGDSAMRYMAVGTGGVIGNGLLAHYIVTLDVAATRAYFEPVERGHATMLYGTGLVLDKPDHETLEVIDVLKDTAAERAGLQAGQKIIAVEGHAARDLALSDAPTFAVSPRGPLTVLTADHRKLDLSFSRLLP
jgi:predicted aspartyl protease